MEIGVVVQPEEVQTTGEAQVSGLRDNVMVDLGPSPGGGQVSTRRLRLVWGSWVTVKGLYEVHGRTRNLRPKIVGQTGVTVSVYGSTHLDRTAILR